MSVLSPSRQSESTAGRQSAVNSQQSTVKVSVSVSVLSPTLKGRQNTGFRKKNAIPGDFSKFDSWNSGANDTAKYSLTGAGRKEIVLNKTLLRFEAKIIGDKELFAGL
jgi:hypothetical protein